MEKTEDEIVRMPMWKSYLYHLQQQAPQPKRIVCPREVPNKPPFYGREYHGAISREEADFLLTIGGEGSYLIRESQRAPGQYTLAIRFDAITKNFKLYYDGQHYVGEKRFDTIQDLVADGLITFYLESKAADYIASLSNQTNYAESPYVAYNTQKRRHMNSKSNKRRSSKRRSKDEAGGKQQHHHHHHHRAKNEVGPPMLHHQLKDERKKKESPTRGKDVGEKESPKKDSEASQKEAGMKDADAQKDLPGQKKDVPDSRAVDDEDDVDGDHDYINQPHYPSRPQNRANQASHAPPKPTPRTSRQSTKQSSPPLKSDEEPLPPPPPSPEQTLKPSDEPLPPPPPSPPAAQPADQAAATQPAAKASVQAQRSFEENARGPGEASRGSPGAGDAAKGAPAAARPKTEASKMSAGVSDVTRGSPGVSDVARGSPGVSDVTRGAAGVSDITRGSAGVSDVTRVSEVTRKSPGVNEGIRGASGVSEVTRRSPGVSEAARETPRVTSSTNTDGPCHRHSSAEQRSPSPRSKSKQNYKMWEEITRATPPGSPALHLFDPDRGGHKPSSVAWCTDYLEVMGCEKPHNFKLHTFKGPHWCDFCANFLWGLIAQGVKCQDCGFNAHKKCSEKVPPDCMPDMRYVKRMFGVDLTTLVKAQNTLIPAVVETCIKEIEKRGLESEGLYRVAGFHDDIEAIKISFDKDGDLTDISEDRYEDLNTITSVLKLYFRLLPIPLLTFDIYFKVIDVVKREDLGLDNKLNALQHALAQLPPAHYHTLKYLMAHLHRVTDKCQQNKMHSDNLAMVFSPTLLRSPDTDPLASLTAVKFERELIEVLITHQSFLFE